MAMEDGNYGDICQLHEKETWRRKCGCLRTSEKLKQVLATFPTPPPPTPVTPFVLPGDMRLHNACISVYCTRDHEETLKKGEPKDLLQQTEFEEEQAEKASRKVWKIVGEIFYMVYLSVTATALALYYLIYCYMQLLYYILRSALYFHNADGAMKITIGLVTVTSIFVAFNLIMKIERIVGFFG